MAYKRDYTTNELPRLALDQRRYWDDLARRRMSRRSILSASARAGVGAAGLALVGCGGDDDDDDEQTVAQVAQQADQVAQQAAQQADGQVVAQQEVAQEQGDQLVGEIPASQERYPWVHRFNWRRLDWGGPPYVGGTIEAFGVPPGDWNVMTTETLTQFPIYMNGLYYSAMHQGIDLDGAAVRPDLALQTQVNPDFTEWTFTLPDNVYFHDIPPVNGARMTSEEVKFSFDRFIDTSVWNLPLSDVERIEAPDPTTVVFKMKRPALNLERVLAMPYFMIFHPEHFDDPDRFSQQVIGTGAWQLTSNEPFVRSTAVRHPRYWGTSHYLEDWPDVRLPFADELNFSFISDPNALDAALRGGEVDSWFATGIRPKRVLDLLDDQPDLQVAANMEWGLTHWRAFLQHNNPLFKDVRVRRALSMAVDRREIVDVTLEGAGVPEATPVPFDQMGLEGPPTPDQMGDYWEYNPEEAKRLLDAAGYGDGFSITALISLLSVIPDWIPLVQKYWGDVGIDVKIEGREDLQLSAALLQKNFDEVILTDGLGSILAYDLPQVVNVYRPGSPQNFGNVDEPRLNDIFERIDNSLEPDEWPTLAREFHDTFVDLWPSVYFAGYHTWHINQPWLHTIANTLYTTILNYSSINWRSQWIDDSAPDGRGGTAVT